MQIVSMGDNLHEMSKLLSGKNNKNFINLSPAVLAYESGKGQKTPTDLSKDINPLTLCKIVADDILYFFLLLFIRESKTLIGLSCESSAQQKIHMACQVLFSLKKQNKTKKQRLLQLCLEGDSGTTAWEKVNMSPVWSETAYLVCSFVQTDKDLHYYMPTE